MRKAEPMNNNQFFPIGCPLTAKSAHSKIITQITRVIQAVKFPTLLNN